MPATIHNDVLVYKGSNFFRQRLLLSTLSGRSIRIEDIRSTHDDPGLREYEVNLIRLLDKVTNGTRVELSETGTSVYFQPGILTGGQVTHSCCTARGIGYYLEILLALGPFCKEPLNAVLQGVTHSDLDVSVDKIKTAALPILLKFILVDDGLELKVVRRGAPPLGGGEIVFKCPTKRHLRPLQWSKWGLVKRIRGVVYALRVSPTMANRVVEAAKGVLEDIEELAKSEAYKHTSLPMLGELSGFKVPMFMLRKIKTYVLKRAQSGDIGNADSPVPSTSNAQDEDKYKLEYIKIEQQDGFDTNNFNASQYNLGPSDNTKDFSDVPMMKEDTDLSDIKVEDMDIKVDGIKVEDLDEIKVDEIKVGDFEVDIKVENMDDIKDIKLENDDFSLCKQSDEEQSNLVDGLLDADIIKQKHKLFK